MAEKELNEENIEENEQGKKAYWNETVVFNIKEYLLHGVYPPELPSSEKRNFRKRAQDFKIESGQLYYYKQGEIRLAIGSKEDQRRIFQVFFVSAAYACMSYMFVINLSKCFCIIIGMPCKPYWWPLR